jgi:hypothetical protein
MTHIESGPIRSLVSRRARLLLVASLSVASFAVLTLEAAPASASVTSRLATVRAAATKLEAHVAPGTWNNAIEVPGSAVLNTGGNAGVVAISCTSSGNCSAGGNYVDGSAHFQAFVVNEVNGTWGTAIEVPGTAALNVGGGAIVNSISCTSDGNCAAGGSYTDSSNDIQGFVVSETGGAWGTATEVVDTAAVPSANAFGVASISCVATGDCSAVGLDVALGGAPVGFAITETNGTWSGALEFPMTSTLGNGGTELNTVSCASPGNCSAEGDGVYTDASVHGGVAFIPIVVDESNGVWGNDALIPGMEVLNVGLVATADGISCASPGNCSLGGNYTDALANAQAFVADETNGTWGDAVEVPGTSTLNVSAAIVNSVSCSSAGNCGASGLYTTATLSEDFVVSETNGTWGTAIEVPGSSSLFIGGAAINANPISCSSVGNCSTGGSYVDTLGNFQAYVDVQRDGAWGDAIEVPGSGALNTDGGGVVTAISCSPDSGCGLGGYYQTGSSTFQGLVTDMTPLYIPQAALTLTSTAGKVGTALKLTTSGGSGMGLVTYFVTNGSAKGCSLSHGALSATSQGTCVVTATKASDGTYAAISTTTSVSMAVPARPRTLTVEFKVGSAALTPAARSELSALAKELVKGATITVTGYAKGNAALARSRATAVANLLKSKAHATIKTVTTSSANSTTVVTTKQ